MGSILVAAKDLCYQRTAERGAKCTTCEHPFGKHSYNLRALGAHATKCLRIAAEKARRALAGARASVR